MKAETSEVFLKIPESPGVQTSAPWASTGQRLLTWFLDRIFVAIIAYVVVFVLTLITVAAVPSLVKSDTEVVTRLIALVGALLSFFLYYSILESTTGRTLGKMIARTRVVCEDGAPCTFRRALLRTLCRLIPFEAFTFLGGGGKPRGLHDSLSKTLVVSTKY